MVIDLLSVLHRQPDYSFSRIVTGNEFWFLYLDLSDHMFAASRDEVIPRENARIEAQRAMLTIFFSGVSLIKMDALPSGVQFTSNIFSIIFYPILLKQEENFLQSSQGSIFCTHGQFDVSQ
jgi:hypothetical protein